MEKLLPFQPKQKKQKKQVVEIYDASIDDMRPVTQADVDRLVAASECFGHLRRLMRFLVEPHPVPNADWVFEVRDKLRTLISLTE